MNIRILALMFIVYSVKSFNEGEINQIRERILQVTHDNLNDDIEITPQNIADHIALILRKQFFIDNLLNYTGLDLIFGDVIHINGQIQIDRTTEDELLDVSIIF